MGVSNMVLWRAEYFKLKKESWSFLLPPLPHFHRYRHLEGPFAKIYYLQKVAISRRKVWRLTSFCASLSPLIFPGIQSNLGFLDHGGVITLEESDWSLKWWQKFYFFDYLAEQELKQWSKRPHLDQVQLIMHVLSPALILPLFRLKVYDNVLKMDLDLPHLFMYSSSQCGHTK